MTSGTGLRERKKAKTRRAIQDAAVRLITEQGFDATTVDQIAEAAEVSQSTFFRYFPTKEDAVLMDDYDPLFLAALAKSPEGTNPIRALRDAMHSVSDVLDRDRVQIHQRTKLMLTTPALRARLADGTLQTERLIRDAVPKRPGHSGHDADAEILLAAAMGALTLVMTRWTEGEPEDDIIAMIDHALALIDPAERSAGDRAPR